MLGPDNFVFPGLVRRRLGLVGLQEHSLPLATRTGALITKRSKRYKARMSVIPRKHKPFNAGRLINVQFYLFRYHR